MAKKKLKGLKKLNNKITALFQSLTGVDGFDCKLDDNFYYYNHKDRIGFTPIAMPEQDEDWIDWITSRYNLEYIPDNFTAFFIFSVLHEIGHHVTLQDYIDTHDTYDSETAYSEDLIVWNSMPREQRKNIRWAYHSIPYEVLATEWAIDFWNNNTMACAKLAKPINKAFQKFYKKNNVRG